MTWNKERFRQELRERLRRRYGAPSKKRRQRRGEAQAATAVILAAAVLAAGVVVWAYSSTASKAKILDVSEETNLEVARQRARFIVEHVSDINGLNAAWLYNIGKVGLVIVAYQLHPGGLTWIEEPETLGIGESGWLDLSSGSYDFIVVYGVPVPAYMEHDLSWSVKATYGGSSP